MNKQQSLADLAVAGAIRGEHVWLMCGSENSVKKAKECCMRSLRHVQRIVGLQSKVRYGANIMHINRGLIQFKLTKVHAPISSGSRLMFDDYIVP